MKKHKIILILLPLIVFCYSCAALFDGEHPVRCIPQFPDQNGWYGGDGAYSLELDQHRTLWLFGDTFVSDDLKRKDRIGMDVVMGSTLAISSCWPENVFSIRYFLKKRGSKFASFFGEDDFLWPQDPFIADKVLYVPLLIVQGLPDAPAPYNFKIAGHKIARIKDFSADDPRKWEVDYLDWTSALGKGIEALAPTSVVHDKHVYFYPLYRHQKDNIHIYGNILARIPISKLNTPLNNFEYLNQDGAWDKNLSHQKVKIVLAAAVSELSVRYHAYDQRWLAVYVSPAHKGRMLLIQTSKSLEGPWSDPAPIISSIPEVDSVSPLYDQHTFCYAGKEHHQYSQENNLVVTYVCNSSEDLNQQTGFLRKNLFLYRPVVHVKKRP